MLPLLSKGPSMQCWRCGCQNKATNEYCEGCGATLGIECSACGHLNGPTARFCGRCSAALKPIAREVSNQSWQHVLRSLNAKGGERSASRYCLLTFAIQPASLIVWATPNWECDVCNPFSTS